MNRADILLLIALCAAVGIAVWLLVKQKRRGGCGGNCKGCPGCNDLKKN